MKKTVKLEIKIDGKEDEVANTISINGYDPRKPMQNSFELIGLLEFIKQQEITKLLKREVRN